MKEQWETEAHEAMDEFITAIKEELGDKASLAEIESAMLKKHGELLSKTMQALVDDQDFSPG